MATNIFISSGQTSVGLTASAGFAIFINSGGTTSATQVTSGGVEQAQGGTAIGTTVTNGGTQFVTGSGLALNSDISGPNSLLRDVNYAGSGKIGVENALIRNGATLQVDYFASASAATVTGGAHALVRGGFAFDTLVSGGDMTVTFFNSNNSSYYGLAFETTVANGGLVVSTGCDTEFTTLLAGGVETVGSRASSHDAVVSNGGTQVVAGGGVISGTVVSSGGTETILATTARVSGLLLEPGSTLDLPFLAFSSEGNGVGYDPVAHLLTITEGGSSVMLDMADTFAFGDTTLAADASGGTALVSVAAPCFVRGTRILTSEGAIPVEALRAGDIAVTAAGLCSPIRWIGHRHVDCARHRDPALVHPVRVAAGAFADGIPRHDLRLSPDHAVFVDGMLVPVQHLINGRSIAQEDGGKVEYWHVELDRHDILLAEGLPVESYLDTGNRLAFDNGGSAITLHPDFAATAWDRACGELVQSGPRLVALKRCLSERAGPLTRPNPALRVLADGRHCTPTLATDGAWEIALPGPARTLCLASQPWMPAACIAESLDRRRLGVRLFTVALDGAVAPVDDLNPTGFHPLEHTTEGWCRWTTGDATIELPAGTRRVTLWLGDATPDTATARVGQGCHQTEIFRPGVCG